MFHLIINIININLYRLEAESNMAEITVGVSEHHAFEAIITQTNLCARTKSPEYAKCLQQLLEDKSLTDCAEI